MDDDTRRGLAEAAAEMTAAPERLKTLILEAARRGERPAAIHRVIFPAYTYDYIAKLIRDDRAAQAGELDDCA